MSKYTNENSKNNKLSKTIIEHESYKSKKTLTNDQ